MEKDFEAALVHYFPALDKTAKKRRPAAKVGERIRAFLDDELEIISDIATKNIFIVNCNGVSCNIFHIAITIAGNPTPFSFRLRLHYKAAVAAGVSTQKGKL